MFGKKSDRTCSRGGQWLVVFRRLEAGFGVAPAAYSLSVVGLRPVVRQQERVVPDVLHH